MKHVKKFSVYLLKKTFFLIYLFSSTPMPFFFILCAIIGTYSKTEANYLVSFSSFFVLLLIISSLLLCILLNTRSTFAFIERMVGLSFLDNHFPPTRYGIRGIYPLAIFIFYFFLIVLTENFSSIFFDSFDTEKINAMREETSRLYNSGEHLKALENDKKVLDEIISSKSEMGFFRKIANNPVILKFINLFSVKKSNKYQKCKKLHFLHFLVYPKHFLTFR